MIKLDDKQLKRFEADLKTFASRAFPFATKQTINGTAFEAQKRAKSNIRESMITRNRFTESSVRVVQARGLVVNRQEARTGSIAAYMADQEFGDTKHSTGKHGVAIPTSYSAGQGEAKPRSRLPRKANALQNVQLSKRRGRSKGSKLQQNFVKVKQAAENGDRYVFLDLRRGPGIFRVLGGKRKPRIRMIADLSRRSVVIPRNPWLAPAAEAARRGIPVRYERALRFQLRRQGILGR